MLNIKRLMQICLLIVVIISSVLLSLSTNSLGLFIIALTCAMGGFIFTDCLKWFRIEGWLANVVSIAILILAMKDFFFVDSSGKLIAVSNLLVYLQGVLMFQNKTPRLNWQILVLSLLQVVITTIFTVGFSNSYLLLVYFVAAGMAMVLQSIYTDSIDIANRNKIVAMKMAATNSQYSSTPILGISGGPGIQSTPLTLFDAAGYRRKTLIRAVGQLFYWTLASLLFTAVLFLMAPRGSRPLFRPISYKVSATGFNNEVNLNETGVIRGSNNIVFRAQIQDIYSDSPVKLGNTPYFRSMALSSLVIEDDQTNWRAPFDRIDDRFYRTLPSRLPRLPSRKVKQIITLEQTTNPMIYGIVPTNATANTPGIIEFCSEVSAHVRCRANGKVSLSPFKYEIGTLVDNRNFTLPGWPHYNIDIRERSRPIEYNSISHRWLTEIDRLRYPILVAEANRLAAQNDDQGGSLQDLVNLYTDYFSGNRFKYTLDYRNVPRDTSIDSVEDFFANHRSGHCEMYASALTLMLRSQNIPARLVVGFMAKDFNELTNNYVVRGKHAHAWVEVYFHPEDCSEEMFSNGIAGPAGSWVTADPNPLSVLAGSSESASDPIELARTVWQDIVLGMEGSENLGGKSNPFLLYHYLQRIVTTGKNSVATIRALVVDSNFQFSIASCVLLFLAGRIYWRSSKIKTARKHKNLEKLGIFRRLVASAVGLISTDLEQWVLNVDRSNTGFYDSMTDILSKYDLRRDEAQTQREFVDFSLLHFRKHESRPLIERVLKTTTERFYEVRFGGRELTPAETQSLTADLDLLKETLAQKSAATNASPSSQP